jgi:hypothetical protein
MRKAPTFTHLIALLVIATLLAPVVVAQTKKHTPPTSMAQPAQKVSMRQMGMNKMKNSERWKAATARADRRADHLRTHGKGGK